VYYTVKFVIRHINKTHKQDRHKQDRHRVEIFGDIPSNCFWRNGWVTGDGSRDAGESGIPGVEV